MIASQENRMAPHGVVVNIESELAYWRQCFEQKSFHQSGQRFETSVPTFKFGYDAYLLHHRHDFDEIAPSLRDRLQRYCPDTPIGWYRAQPIMRAVWQRLKPSVGHA